MTLRVVGLTLILCALTGIAQAEYQVLDQPELIFPGQTFRICLQQAAGAGEIKVQVPPTLELYDRWDQDSIQRFYFRALKDGAAPLVFSGAGGEAKFDLQVLPWAELMRERNWGKTPLPRVWPVEKLQFGELKTRRTLHSEQEMQALKGAKVGGTANKWHDMPDQAIFHIIPGPCVPRTCLINLGFEGVGKGCPVCGDAVYKGRSGFYPWLMDPDKHPWKVGCPNCGNWFPSNDYAAGDMHSGDFPDDGFGCEPVKPVLDNNGKPWRFPFIAYYHEWQSYMRMFTPGIIESARASVATGDKVFAHKCAIALFRYAESMQDMSVNMNHRKMAVRDAILRGPVGAPKLSRIGGSFMYIQPNWDTPRMEDAARAWDLIFDQIQGDEELLKFCQANHHPEIKTFDDFRRFIEAGVIRVPLQACLDNAIARNYPMQETTLATMALALGTPQTMEVVDGLLNTTGIRFALTNNFYQDGGAYESESYNSIQISDMARLFHTLERLRELHPELYKEPRFVSLLNDPRYRRLYDFCLDYSMIGRTTPSCGDTGSCAPASVAKESQGVPLDPQDLAEAYRATKDPKYLQALYGPGGTGLAKINDPALRAEAERVGKEQGWQVAVPSNFLDGYGYALLRSGRGPNQRALWVRYQQCLQHRHPDMLTFGLEAMQRKLLPELGYPQGWSYATHWETNWGTHYGVKIAGVSTWDFNRGKLRTFAAAEPVQVAEAESSVRKKDNTYTRRRLVALVDISDEDCYAISLERVSGGEEQTWVFHGPDGEATAEGVTLQPYEGTALEAGRKVGDLSNLPDKELASLALMRTPSRGETQGPWSLDYLLRDQKDVHLRMTSLSPLGTEVTLAKGQAPGGRSSYDLTFALQRQKGQGPLLRQYLNVLEPYQGTRKLQKIEPLTVTGEAKDGAFPPLALRVTGEGFTDTIIIQDVPTRVQAGGLTSDGVFALWRERDGKMQTACLVQGTEAAGAGGAKVTLPVGAYEGKIASCDWAQKTIRVELGEASSKALSGNAQGLVGRHVLLTNEAGNTASYAIQKAKVVNGGCELGFEFDSRIGEGFVDAVADRQVTSSANLIKWQYGYYAGKVLANEDGSATYRLADVKGTACTLADGAEGKVKADVLKTSLVDKDGDGLARFVIYDYGIGDRVTIPAFAVVNTR